MAPAPYPGFGGYHAEQYPTGPNFPPHPLNYPYPNYNQQFFPPSMPHHPAWNQDHPNADQQHQQTDAPPQPKNNEKSGYKYVYCVKCSWHFRFTENSSEQEARNRIALDSHVKEAHYEPGNCTFCVSDGQIHPTSNIYKCGYKPFKCEICNFCANSKGNC